MNIAQRMDIFFSKSITTILTFLGLAVLLDFGVRATAKIILEIFEYNQWLSDLSDLEIIFFSFLIILLYRHYKLCRYFHAGFWTMISSPFFALGLIFVAESAIRGTVIVLPIHTFLSSRLPESIDIFISNGTLDLVLILAAIYLSTPSAEVQTNMDESVTDKVEEHSSSPDLTSSKHADGLINKQYSNKRDL